MSMGTRSQYGSGLQRTFVSRPLAHHFFTPAANHLGANLFMILGPLSRAGLHLDEEPDQQRLFFQVAMMNLGRQKRWMLRLAWAAS